MEKRMILAIGLSIAVLLGYQYLVSPPPGKDGATSPAVSGKAAPKDNIASPGVRSAPGAVAGQAAQAFSAGLSPKRENPLRQIKVTTPLFAATISTGGGGIQSFLLKEYKDKVGPAGKPLDIIGSGGIRPLPFDLYLEGASQPFPSLPLFASSAPDLVTVGPGEKKSVLLAWESAAGVRVTREYVFSGDKYDFEILAQVANGGKEPLGLKPGLELTQEYKGELEGDSYGFTGAVIETGGKVEQFDFKKIDKEREKIEKQRIRWAAADAKYFALILIPEKEWVVEKASRVGEQGLRLSVADSPATLSPGDQVRFSSRVFAGPKMAAILDAAGKNLGELVDYGWFSVLAKPLVWAMKASNRVTRNYGIDIILLTILIKILFYPLTKKSMVSMKKMQDLAPILSKLKEKYKDDPARMNQETMNLYKTYKINPLSGCLPMLLQIPVFIALYKGLLVTIELRHSPFFLWINDLSAPEHLWDLAVAGYTIPLRLLPLLMGISMFVQQKMTPTGGADPAQQKMMLFLPVIFTFMFWGFPTGLVIYWLMNNILSIGQQVIHNRQAEAAKAASAPA